MAEFGRGVAGGALTGSSIGMGIGGPIGGAIGLGVGALAGGLQAQGAKRQRLKAEAADKAINPIDPNQQALLNRLGSLERGYRAGTDPASAFAAQGQQNALAQTQANMVRGGIGNVNNLLRSQQAANVGMAQIGAAAGQNANALIPLQANIQNAVTERLYQRQQQKRADAYSRSAQSQQDLNNLLSGGLGTALQVAGNYGQSKSMTPGTTDDSSYNQGGFVGDQYVPGVTTGINYAGLGKGQRPRENFGFDYTGARPMRRGTNFGFNY